MRLWRDRHSSAVLVVTGVLVASLGLAACGTDSGGGRVASSTGVSTVSASPTIPPGRAIAPPRGPRALWGDIALQPVRPNAGIEALAHLEADDRSSPAELTVLAGLPPGGSYTLHVHGGSCAIPSANPAQLGTMTVGPNGLGQVVFTRLPGPAGAQNITLDLIADAAHAIDIHDSAGALVACGDIPSIGVR